MTRHGNGPKNQKKYPLRAARMNAFSIAPRQANGTPEDRAIVRRPSAVGNIHSGAAIERSDRIAREESLNGRKFLMCLGRRLRVPAPRHLLLRKTANVFDCRGVAA